MKISHLTFQDVAGLHAPQTTDAMVEIRCESSFEQWRNKITSRFGDVDVQIDRDNDTWFNRIRINDNDFISSKQKYTEEVMRDMSRR